MEKFPNVFDDEGLVYPFRSNLKAMSERLREHAELAAEPLVFTQRAVVTGFKKARALASAIAELPEYGDNQPAEPAMIYARLRR